MKLGQRFAGQFRVDRGRGFGGLERAFDVAQFAIAVEDEFDRRRRHGGGFLRDVGDRPGLGQLDLPGVLMEFPAQEREQAGLAAPVGPDQADLVPRMEGEVCAIQQALGAAGKREVGESDQDAVKSNS